MALHSVASLGLASQGWAVYAGIVSFTGGVLGGLGVQWGVSGVGGVALVFLGVTAVLAWQ